VILSRTLEGWIKLLGDREVYKVRQVKERQVHPVWSEKLARLRTHRYLLTDEQKPWLYGSSADESIQVDSYDPLDLKFL
jgi:hypothetical protein